MRENQLGILVRVSILALVSVLIAAYLVVVLGTVRFTDVSRYQANFVDASLLTKGSEVRIAGVQVGKVTDVRIVEGHRAQAEFNVDSTVDLTASTEVVVRYKNLIGDRYLELLPGAASAEAPQLQPGATIPAKRNKAALDLNTLFNGFKPLFDGLNPAQINELSNNLVQVLQGQGAAITPLLASIASVTHTLAARDQVIGQVISNLEVVLTTIADRDTAVANVVSQLQGLLSGLKGDAPGMLDSVVAINSFTASATDLLVTASPQLAEDLPLLQAVTTTVNADADTIQTVLNALPQAYKTLQRTGSYGNFFNTYLCGIRVKLSDPGAKNPTITPYLVDSQVPRCQ